MSLRLKMSVNWASTECQQSVIDLGCYILYNPRAVLWHLSIFNVMAAVMSKRDRDMVTSPVWNWASTDRQRFWVLHLVQSKSYATEFTHNRRIGSLYSQYRLCQYCYTSKWVSTERSQSINRASTEHQHNVNRVSTECPRFWALHLVYYKGSATGFTHHQHIGSRYEQKRSQQSRSPSLKMSINRASTILFVESCIIQWLCYGI